MKKILQKTNWERYKNSTEGQDVIALFNHLCTPECTINEMLNAIERFNPNFGHNWSKKEEKNILDSLGFFEQIVSEDIKDDITQWSNVDFQDYYIWLTLSLITDNKDDSINDVPQVDFKRMLSDNMLLSFALYKYMPNFFIPNLFTMQFPYFQSFAKKYELDMPEMPHRSDYRGRWLYYLAMCDSFDEFAYINDIQNSGELCAFLFDYELTNIKEEMAVEFDKPMPSVPEQAWILVGNYGEGEQNMDYGFWQANQLTCKGDIMLFYEKSPVKKLNAVWTALEDGFIDPFGHFYFYAIIGKKTTIPDDKAITFEDFKNSEYFKNRTKEGNYVSKNFQDVSGWAVTSEDYAEIKLMLEQKGFDTSVLPSLYEPKKLSGVALQHEADVSEKLLVPLLEEMGWKKDVDFKAEVEFPAGRGTTGHSMDKRPDFCLHLTGTERDLGAKVVIEVKFNMRNNEEISANYDQGLSYAKWGNAQVLVLCDKNQIRVYERNNNGVFEEKKWKRFRWEEMESLEKFNELKRLLS